MTVVTTNHDIRLDESRTRPRLVVPGLVSGAIAVVAAVIIIPTLAARLPRRV